MAPSTTRRKTPPRSAGILLYRRTPNKELEVLLIHPGGPFWAKRDEGVWSIPKGAFEPGEEALAAARREFREELGTEAPAGSAVDLGEVTQRAGKVVHAFALEGDLNAAGIASNTCLIEWPPRSGRQLEIPEVDRAEWFGLEEAREKINSAQAELLDRLGDRV